MKFDFFVMAGAVGFRYVKIRPAVQDVDLVTVSPVMLALLRWRGFVARSDMAALRCLRGFGRFTLQS